MPRRTREPFVRVVAPTTFHQYLAARDPRMPAALIEEVLSNMEIPGYLRLLAARAAERTLKTLLVGTLLDSGEAVVKSQAMRLAKDAALRTAHPGVARPTSPFLHVVQGSSVSAEGAR